MADVFGHPLHRNKQAKDESTQARVLFEVLGLPAVGAVTKLPMFPAKLRKYPRAPWPDALWMMAGSCGVRLLDSMLAWAPADRPDCDTILRHHFVLPESLVPTADSPHSGFRHEWIAVQGCVASEVLSWLRADSGFDALNVRFEGGGADWKTEEGRKYVHAAAISTSASNAMCALSLKGRFPLTRAAHWFSVFRLVNAEAFAAMNQAAATVVRKLGAAALGENGADFLHTPLNEWLLTCGELCISRAGGEGEDMWNEPRHKDGGGSVLHLGITLFGKRLLRCEQADGQDIVVENFPGTVYLGTLTGCYHQVHHKAAAANELYTDAGWSVTIMCRCALFGANRARLRNTTPSPVPFFLELTKSFTKSLLQFKFKLPTMTEILSVFDENNTVGAGLLPAGSAAGGFWGGERATADHRTIEGNAAGVFLVVLGGPSRLVCLLLGPSRYAWAASPALLRFDGGPPAAFPSATPLVTGWRP